MKKVISTLVIMLFMCTTITATSYAKRSSRSSSRSSSKSYSSRSTYKPATKINLSKSKPSYKKPVVKTTTKKDKKNTVVNKNTTVVNKTTVVNSNQRNNGMTVGDAIVTGMMINAVTQPSNIYHNAPYHDPYSNRTVDFTCIDGMKYKLTMNGDIKPYKVWFKHKQCTDFEIEHYAQGRR